MSVGLLLLTHGKLGNEMLDVADGILGKRPLETKAIGVSPDDDPDALTRTLESMLDRLDQGDGVLVLTDLYGATPCNVIRRLQTRHRTTIVTGVNLPMLMKVFNYHASPLAELTEAAIKGGRSCILQAPDREA